MQLFSLDTGDMMLDDMLVTEKYEKEAFALPTNFVGEEVTEAGSIATFTVLDETLGQDLYNRLLKD